MGASSSDRKKEILFSAYKSFENNINHMKELKKFSKDVYLISTKTIPNFISIIKKYYGNEKKLKKNFADYEFEKNIKVYSSYKECINVVNNKEENEFIIVDNEFILKMDIRDSYPVNLEYDGVDGANPKIIFPVSQFLINIKQKDNELGIYEFFIDKDEFNPSTIVKMQNNENNKKISQSFSHLENDNNLNYNNNNNNYKYNYKYNNNYNNFNYNNFNNNDLNNNPNNNINFNGNKMIKSSMLAHLNNKNYYANN